MSRRAASGAVGARGGSAVVGMATGPGVGVSDVPRVPACQAVRLFPGGVPASWAPLVEQPRRRPRVRRLAAGLASAAAAVAAVASDTAAGIAGSLLATTGGVLSAGGQVLGQSGTLVFRLVSRGTSPGPRTRGWSSRSLVGDLAFCECVGCCGQVLVVSAVACAWEAGLDRA
jgi:hypothetical protein